MATAAAKSRTEIDSVTVTLSKDEADALYIVALNVGGDRYNGPRKHIDAVRQALSRAGIIGSTGTRVSGNLYVEQAKPKPSYDAYGLSYDVPTFL